MVAIYPIVEGHGEVKAVPVLLRRIAWEIRQRHDVEVLAPHQLPRGRMLAGDMPDLERAVELGAGKIAQTGGAGAIMVLLDANDDCPAVLGPALVAKSANCDLE